MTAGLWISLYLVIGVAGAYVLHWALDVLLRDLDNGTLRGDQLAQFRDIESRIRAIPGGVPTVMVLLALLWPFALIAVIRGWRRK